MYICNVQLTCHYVIFISITHDGQITLAATGTGFTITWNWTGTGHSLKPTKNGYTLPFQSDVQEMRHREGCIP